MSWIEGTTIVLNVLMLVAILKKRLRNRRRRATYGAASGTPTSLRNRENSAAIAPAEQVQNREFPSRDRVAFTPVDQASRTKVVA